MIEYTSERRCFLMASKGQKFHKFSDIERESIVNCYLSGNGSLQDVGNKYGISRKTVYNMVRKYRNTGSVKSIKRNGRPKEKDLTKEDWKERYEILKKYQAFLEAQRKKK